MGSPRPNARPLLLGGLLGRRLVGLGRAGSLDGVEGFVFAERGVGFVVGHSHTDHVLNSQRTPLAKA